MTEQSSDSSPHNGFPCTDATLLRSILFLGLLVLGLKVTLSSQLGLVWDEAHFWVSGQHTAWGYSDVPAGWPLLTTLSTALFGETQLGARVLSLLMGAGLILGVWFLTKQIAGRRDALWAAGAALLFPIITLQGLFAFPEVAIELCTLWTLAFAVRALEHNQTRDWLFAGLVCALGLFFHYRFALLPLALFLFLLLPQNHFLWRQKGIWLAGASSSLGLLPTLIHNIENNFAPLSYHLVSRHDWAFDAIGLTHIFKQAGLVTPFFFVGLMGACWAAWTHSQTGNKSASLILFCSGFIFFFYALLAPFTYDPLVHWPFSAYAPLLAFLPQALRYFVAAGAPWRRWAVFFVPLSGLLSSLMVFFFLASFANPNLLPKENWARFLQGDFESWAPISEEVERLKNKHFSENDDVLIVAGHHRLSALMQFYGKTDQTPYTLWHPQDDTARFSAMRKMWQEDEDTLRQKHGGEKVLILMEVPKRLTLSHENVALYYHRCHMFEDIKLVGEEETRPDKRNVQIFTATLKPYEEKAKPLALPETAEEAVCLFLPHFFLFHPFRGQTLSGTFTLSGWASWPEGLKKVELILDGTVVATMVHSIHAVGHKEYDAFLQKETPPKVGIWGRLDTTQYENGAHRLGLRIETNSGESFEAEERTVYIINGE